MHSNSHFTAAKVFLSHSHDDRSVATSLQHVLEKHGAETFLDQDRILAGDELSPRLQQGVSACTAFVLVWSLAAARSRYVALEVEYAKEKGRRIIPYRLDSTPLPKSLQDVVYIPATDQWYAHAQLLRAIYGATFAPAATEFFPGRWLVTMKFKNLGAVDHDLALRTNGQVSGTCAFTRGGILGLASVIPGIGLLFRTRGEVTGSWTYESVSKDLTLNLNFFGLGQTTSEQAVIRLTGKSWGKIIGQDAAQRNYVLKRLASERA